jgi:hypothetical protein
MGSRPATGECRRSAGRGRGTSPQNTLRRNRLPPLARGHATEVFGFDDPQKIRFRGEVPRPHPTPRGETNPRQDVQEESLIPAQPDAASWCTRDSPAINRGSARASASRLASNRRAGSGGGGGPLPGTRCVATGFHHSHGATRSSRSASTTRRRYGSGERPPSTPQPGPAPRVVAPHARHRRSLLPPTRRGTASSSPRLRPRRVVGDHPGGRARVSAHV